jgi:Flp pilus assembly protein TadG
MQIDGRMFSALGRDFQSSEKGTVALIFGLAALVLFLVTGLAIDVGRVMHAERKIASAIDAAALASAKALRETAMTDGEVEAVAQKFFDNNSQYGGGAYAVINSVSIRVDRRLNAVTIDVDSHVPTLFGHLAGVPQFNLPKSSVAIYDTKDIEVGLQLDVTGSMCSPCRKIDELKDAVAGPGGMLDIMLPDGGTSNKVRIGLAPFAAGVNAGDYALAVSGGTAANGCVYERLNLADQDTDAPAVGTQRFKSRADLPGASPCPNARVMAITDDKVRLRNEIRSWSTGGSTAGHLGASWAWNLVSPQWSAIWPGASRPAPYNDGKTMKVVVLMTDGIYNTVGGRNGGDHGPLATQSTGFAEATCDAMKAQGVVVYTIGFEAPNAVKASLRKCASSDAKFFDAEDGASLREAFRAIAAEINSLRLSS